MDTRQLPVRALHPADPINMGGMHILQALPAGGFQQLDPFLLLHHAQFEIPAGSRPREEGVPPHPHRGFEPVTFIYQGGVHHRDSRGNDSVIGPGGVQWMTAGLGIVHSERPPKALAEVGGTQEVIQLWVNLPSQSKMVAPRYQGYSPDALPVIRQAEGEALIQVIAGTLAGTTGPVETHSPILALNLMLQAGGHTSLPIPTGYNAFAYLLDGQVQVNDSRLAQAKHFVAFEPGPGTLHLAAEADTRILLMAGQPLDEPVVSSGPFVMNTTTEILEAMRDYRMGKMGVLVEDF